MTCVPLPEPLTNGPLTVIPPPLPTTPQVAVQISQMVQFIRKEAEEKANEIKAAAQEEYTIQKQTMVEA